MFGLIAAATQRNGKHSQASCARTSLSFKPQHIRHTHAIMCSRTSLLALLAAVVVLAAAGSAQAAEDNYSPARALLQSGTSCPNQIPGCMPRRCTTRTVDSVKDRYVCLRCKAGFVPVLSSNRKSIIQCICPAGFYMPTTGPNAATCQPCTTGNYCPGGDKKANSPSSDMGTQKSCNNPGAGGLTTKQGKATKPTDCVAEAGYVLPTAKGGNATLCVGDTYAPSLNKLSACLKCQSGLKVPDTYSGPQIDKNAVCQVPPGRFWELNVVRDCPKGLYRSGYELVTAKAAISCLPCPLGWTTPGIATTGVGFCSALLPGFMVNGFTPGADTSGATNVVPQSGDQVPLNTTACPIGFYFDGNSTGVYACVACPTGSTTRQNGSTSLDDCVVPPGYFLKTSTGELTKCPNNVTGSGYYRSGWVSFKLAQDTDGTKACSKCGSGILSEPRDTDERDDLPATSSDPYLGKVAASPQSCYIEAGWGITFDPSDFKSFRAIAPCPANTYGVANRTYGLINAPCKACSKNLYAPAGSTDYTACKNPAGFGYNSEGANQCADGFYSPAQQMQPCIQCPPCRTTPPYVPGDGTLQNSVDNCLVIPGCGVHRPNDTNPWDPEDPKSDDPAKKCPIGMYTTAADDAGNTTANPVCKKCPAGLSTAAEGSTSCDVCAEGYGAVGNATTGNATADCGSTCPFGYFGAGQSTSCGKCPDTVFNHPVGNAYTSYGVTFYQALSGPESCVPRFSQQANPSGHIMSVDDRLFSTTTQNSARATCIETCPEDKCCINQFEAASATDEETGTCKQAVLEPVGPDTTTGKLYYKLPPSEVIAAASDKTDKKDSVKAKTQSSGIYARCALGALGDDLAKDGLIGTSPFADDVEKDKSFVRWNEPGCKDEATCQATCDALATCWGFIYHKDKGFAIRGGEMQLGFRTFFASPDATKAPAGFNMVAKQWGKPTSTP